MLYDPWPSRRKKILVAILAIVAVALVAVIVFSIRQKKQEARQKGLNEQKREAKSAEDKQKAMLDAINKASQEGAKENSATPNGEQDKKKQEMQDAISKTNSQTQPISQEESARRAQDMFNEMNKANKK